MGKNKNKNNNTQTPDHTLENHEDVVSFVSGSHDIIDIAAIRAAQANEEADLSDEELLDEASSEDLSVSPSGDLSLDAEADLIRAEMAADPELQKDVLEGYSPEASNQDIDQIAEKVTAHTKKQIAEFKKLAHAVSDELNAENLAMIMEDKLLESEIAKEAVEAATEAAALEATEKKSKKSKKAKKSETSDEATLEASASELSDEGDVEVEEMSEQDAELKAALPQLDENGNYDLEDLQSCISALLFYSDKPVSLKKMKEMLEMPEAEDEVLLRAINGLKDEFTKLAHGFEIADIAGGYQLRTKITRAPLLRKLAKVQIQRLSRGAMETLTIVAYKQPCTKDDIDQVRGVDSSHFIRTLLDRNLIAVTGRSEAAGRPMIYETTTQFLEVFGLMDMKGLPPLHEIEAMVPQLAAQEEGAEDPRVIQMRKMVHQMKEDSNHLDYDAKEDDQILQEIRDRVKSIDVTTPYLARQKQLAEEGIHGADAEEILSKEFGFHRDETTGMALEATGVGSQTAAETSEGSEEHAPLEAGDLTDKPAIIHQANLDLDQEHVPEDLAVIKAREALENMDLDEGELS